MKNTHKFFLVSALLALTSHQANAQEPVWDGNKVVLQSEKIADGVFAYYPTDAQQLSQEGKPVATSGGFIIGDKGVLLIETMLN